MKLPCLLQPRILKTALKALFSPAYTTKFPFRPYEPIKEFRGRPRFQEKDCIGCGACAQVCPSKCIDVLDEPSSRPPVRRLVQHFDACIECGQCERYCTTEKGIRLTNEYDFLGFEPKDFEEKVEKELFVCEGCGEVIAPVDQLRWIGRRLGPLTFCNPALMLTALRDLAAVDPALNRPHDGTHRADRLTIQCPRCRRKSAFEA